MSITDQAALLVTLRERKALDYLHRLLEAAQRQSNHPDLDYVDTPDLTDQIAEVTEAMGDRDLAVSAYEGNDFESSQPPRNHGGARC